MQRTADNIFWDQLLEVMAEGHVVPIIGRDLLTVRYCDQEVLLYPLIAQQLAKYLGVSTSNLPENDEINTVVYRFLETGNRIEDIYPALKIVMPAVEQVSIPEPLLKLASIPPLNLFVTTTFDSLLERAINQVRFGGLRKTQVYSYAPNAVEDLPGSADQTGRPVIYHLFGRLSAIPSYAVTQEDVLEFLHSLQSEGRAPSKLFDELNRTNVMILGCNFEGWLARFFIRTAKHQRLLETRGSTDYLADTGIGSDRNLVLFLRHYSSRTKIYEGKGGADFIDELYHRWVTRYPIVDTSTVKARVTSNSLTGPPGSVFLSYANEDLAAVVNIRNALEAEGIDVVLDKNKLQAGDDFESTLNRSISECALFIPIISKNTLTEQRRFFRIEWNWALDEARKVAPTERFIVPVVIDDTPATETAVPERFRKLQWEKLRDGHTTPDFLKLIKELYRRYQKREGGAL